MPTQANPQPNWQPISALPAIATALDDMLETAHEQQANLQQVQERPYLLDDQIPAATQPCLLSPNTLPNPVRISRILSPCQNLTKPRQSRL